MGNHALGKNFESLSKIKRTLTFKAVLKPKRTTL